MLIEMRDIAEFHKKFGLIYEGKPRPMEASMIQFRRDFLVEEADEWHKANMNMHRIREDIEELSLPLEQITDKAEVTHQMAKSLDAIIDLVYVALGNAYMQGFQPEMIEEAWRRVHEANMKKVRATTASMSARNSVHDVVKPPGWTPPNHDDLVEDHIYAKLP